MRCQPLRRALVAWSQNGNIKEQKEAYSSVSRKVQIQARRISPRASRFWKLGYNLLYRIHRQCLRIVHSIPRT
ncbi:hypothetical protein FLL89_18115 [Vibrio cholerae]|nr:hypothetical protein FLL90_15455 [Vibrio cholerae]TQP78875.1 hypothetical protein FLL89_18115 [Vibrio cholerae]